MIADGIHSASDLITDIVVIAVLGISRRRPDASHSYGHGKIETFASFIISLLLGGVAIGIAIEGVEKIIAVAEGEILPRPGWIALAMGVVSVVAKEWLFRYTRSAARKIGSSAMEANAWHHRSDAYSSIATIVGIAGAMFLGDKWRILDPVAAIFVGILILVMAYRLGRDAVGELVETSLPHDETNRIKEIIAGTPGVISYHNLRTRRNGRQNIIDVHIYLQPSISLVEAHTIATHVERRLRTALAEVSANIHMEPNPKSPDNTSSPK